MIAFWDLIHAGIVYAVGAVHEGDTTLQWTNARPGVGGSSSSINFDRHRVILPPRVHPSPLAAGGFTDGDLFVREIGVPDLHAGVAKALSEAALCFRHGLLTPCVAMLGAAMEGAWVEFGKALLTADSAFAKQEEIITGAFSSLPQKMKAVENMYLHPGLEAARTSSRVKAEQLSLARDWSNAVRLSRNVLHWDNEAPTPNSYDKVATLLLTTPVHMQALNAARRAVVALVATQAKVSP